MLKFSQKMVEYFGENVLSSKNTSKRQKIRLRFNRSRLKTNPGLAHRNIIQLPNQI